MPQWETHEPGVGTMLILKPYGRRFTSVRARVQSRQNVESTSAFSKPFRCYCWLPVQTIQCFYSIAAASPAPPPRPQIALHQTRAAATPRASLPCLSYRLLTSARHAEPFEHAILCRPPTATAVNDTMVRLCPQTLQRDRKKTSPL
jgi:hypothetical protein